MYPSRLRYGVHAARDAHGPVEDERARRLLRAEHVHADGAGRRGLPAEADELPRAHPDLQELAEELSRPAGAAGGVGQRVSLRALGHHAWPAARTRIHAG